MKEIAGAQISGIDTLKCFLSCNPEVIDSGRFRLCGKKFPKLVLPKDVTTCFTMKMVEIYLSERIFGLEIILFSLFSQVYSRLHWIRRLRSYLNLTPKRQPEKFDVEDLYLCLFEMITKSCFPFFCIWPRATLMTRFPGGFINQAFSQ